MLSFSNFRIKKNSNLVNIHALKFDQLYLCTCATLLNNTLSHSHTRAPNIPCQKMALPVSQGPTHMLTSTTPIPMDTSPIKSSLPPISSALSPKPAHKDTSLPPMLGDLRLSSFRRPAADPRRAAERVEFHEKLKFLARGYKSKKVCVACIAALCVELPPHIPHDPAHSIFVTL